MDHYIFKVELKPNAAKFVSSRAKKLAEIKKLV